MLRMVSSALVLLAIGAASPASAFPWGKVLTGKQTAKASVRLGQRDLLYEIAPGLVSRMRKAPTNTKAKVAEALYLSVKKGHSAADEEKALAEFTVGSGKLNVSGEFWLGPLKVKGGEFDLKTWALAAGGAYVYCSKGKPLSEMSEKGFEGCMDNAMKEAAKLFGWKDPSAGL